MSQTGKEFGAYLQLICINFQELGEKNFLSEKLFIHYMQQGLRPEFKAVLYLNPTILKD